MRSMCWLSRSSRSACDAPRTVAELGQLVRAAHPYRQLSDEGLDATLEMLSGHYPSQDFADLRPLLAWDRTTDTLRPRRAAAMLTRMNAGTIPDRGNYTVTLGTDGARLGELDEEMVFETRAGENILLGIDPGASRRSRATGSLCRRRPASRASCRSGGATARGDRSNSAGRRGHDGLAGCDAAAARRQWLRQHAALDESTAERLIGYLDEQKTHAGVLPTDRRIVIERFRDELGDWRVCILSPFGARVHAPWAMALQHELTLRNGFDVQVMYTDDGIVLRFANVDDLPDLDVLLPDPEDVDERVTEQLAHTAMFAGLFRENAARALLLPRRRPDQRTPLWAQRLKSQNLLAAVRQYPGFPIVLETYRQALATCSILWRCASCYRQCEAGRSRSVTSRRPRRHRSHARWYSPTWRPTSTNRMRRWPSARPRH